MLISKRPQNWNEVIGQDRVIRLIRAILHNPKYMTMGYVLAGPYAVGKTSVARLLAKALACIGDDPMGCGTCPSCVEAQEDSYQNHPNIKEVDGANFSGVDSARELIGLAFQQPAGLVSRRRVIIIDEAHRLSPEAFDVFLKPLEVTEPNATAFLYVTSDEDKIPRTIMSRSVTLRFGSVADKDLTGWLMKRADMEGIAYTSEGLQTVARASAGRPRDAVKNLGVAAALGKVTMENAEQALNYNADLTAQLILCHLIQDAESQAVALAEDLAQRIQVERLIESVFSVYAREAYAGGGIAMAFQPLSEMTRFFLKWSGFSSLPSAIVPAFVMELQRMLSGRSGGDSAQSSSGKQYPKYVPDNPSSVPREKLDRPVTADDLLKKFGAPQ